jgi:hypothetical protein
MRRWRAACAGLAISAATVLTAAGAQAATVTVGSNFSAPTNTDITFGGSATITNVTLPAPANAASPADGTVISWRFIGEGGLATPRIIRPTGGNLYTGAGTGPGQVGAGYGNIAGPFTVSLPIRKGDLFGVSFPVGTGPSMITPSTGASGGLWQPALADGATPEGTSQTFPNQEVAIGAVVRYCLVPNLRGKKPKAARQALAAADCTAGPAKKSKKRRKKKKVLTQSVAPGTSISDTAPVGFKVSKLKK